MGIIIIGIVIFLLGLLTPINEILTLPISIFVVILGIFRVVKRSR